MNTSHLGLCLTLVGAAFVACSSGPSGTTVVVVPGGWADAPDGGVITPASVGTGVGSQSGSGQGTGAGSGTGATGSGSGASSTECLPADVASLLTAKCTVCHGDPPLASALSGLVTVADLKATSKLDSTKNEAQESVVLMGETSGATAMPPGTGDPADVTTIQTWITDGYPTVACGPSTGSGSGSGSSTGSGSDAGTAGVPCNVATMLAANCTVCHSDPPINGSLAGLVTLADLQATSHLDSTKNEAQESVALMTLTSGATAMPPTTGSSAANIAILQDWITAGYPAGAACGGDGGAPPPNLGVFAGAPAYVAGTGNNAHNAGKNCMQCHSGGGGGGGDDDAPQFEIGGTVYNGSGVGVGGAEVRLVDANNNATSVYTGSNGTFYIRGSGFAGPAHVGVRNASAVQNMITALQSGSQPPATTGGACSACHCTGSGCTVSDVHLP